MAGMIEFNTLRHFKDRINDYYTLKMDGGSIEEYLFKIKDNKYMLSLPLLGEYVNAKSSFNPDDIFRDAFYWVKLWNDDIHEFTISREGTTGWL